MNKSELDKITKLASKGNVRGAIAKAFGLTSREFNKLIASDEKIRDAVLEGEMLDLNEVTLELRKRGVNGSAKHLEGFLSVRHQISPKGNGAENKSVTINVSLPFATGSDHRVAGITIDQEPEKLPEP